MIKKDFPIFNVYPELVYLDNGATSQKPQVLMESLQTYYSNYNSNIGRGIYKLAEKSQYALEQSKVTIAQFIGTQPHNLIFTSGATESSNMIAYLVKQVIPENTKILLSIYEHHSNLLVWQRLAKEKNLTIEFIKDDAILLDPNSLSHSFFNNVSLLALTHVSNVTGQSFPIEQWVTLCKKNNIISVIDGAQGITSHKLQLDLIKPDFYSFSAHKIYGPMGLGVTYFSPKYLSLEPYKLGGGIIEDVEENGFELSEEINRFEAGTPNVANIFAFAKVLDYLNDNNWSMLKLHTHLLNTVFQKELKNFDFIKVLPNYSESIITSFNIEGIHPHDVGTFLSSKNIAVRVGKHCAYPLHSHLNINSSIRVSFAIYNTLEDVQYTIKIIKQCYEFFNRG